MDDNWFDQIKAAYPKRGKGCNYGWPQAFKLIQGHMKDGHSFETILKGTQDYCTGSKLCGNFGTEYIKQASTFFGPGLHFLDEYETEDVEEVRTYRQPEEYSDEQRKADADKAWRELNKLKGVS